MDNEIRPEEVTEAHRERAKRLNLASQLLEGACKEAVAKGVSIAELLDCLTDILAVSLVGNGFTPEVIQEAMQQSVEWATKRLNGEGFTKLRVVGPKSMANG